MARYTQLTPDLCRAALDNKCERALLTALEYIGLSERLDAPYGEVRRAFAKLSEVGIELQLEELIGAQLADRARANRKRIKSKALAVASHGTDTGTAHGTKIKEREERNEKQKEEKREEKIETRVREADPDRAMFSKCNPYGGG